MYYIPKYCVTLAVVCVLIAKVALCGSILNAARPIAGPMNIVLRSLEACPKRIRGDDGLVFHNLTSFHPKGRPYEFYMTANVSLNFPIDDTLSSELRLSQWTSREGWKTGMKTMKISQLCTALRTYAGKIWENIVIEIFGKKMPCPLPPFDHGVLQNVSFNTKSIPIREFVYGRWRCDVIMLHAPTGTTKACLRVFSDVVPAVSD